MTSRAASGLPSRSCARRAGDAASSSRKNSTGGRDGGGKGVHFSGAGLRRHAALWAEKVTPWLQNRLDATEER